MSTSWPAWTQSKSAAQPLNNHQLIYNSAPQEFQFTLRHYSATQPVIELASPLVMRK